MYGILLTADKVLDTIPLNELKDGQKDIFMKYYDLAHSEITYGGLSDYLKITQTDADMMSTIWKVFAPLAIGLLILYMLMHMITEFSSGRKDPDVKSIALELMKMALGYILILEGPGIIGALASVGNYFLDRFASLSLINGVVDAEEEFIKRTEYATRLFNACKELGTLSQIGMKAELLLIDILGNIPMIGLVLQAISRKLEMILRGGMAVIALPNIYNGDGRSGAIKYLKKYAALALSGAGFVIVVNVAGQLNKAEIMNALLVGDSIPTFSTILNAFLYNFAAVGLVPVVKSALNELFD